VALVATTARAQGRQFVAIAAGGGNILAFGLADKQDQAAAAEEGAGMKTDRQY